MRDPYVYEGTNVLINKLNIRDENELGRAESEFVIFAIEELKNESFVVNNIFDALKIHKYLFKDLYEWAGCARTIDVYKGESLLDGKSIDYVFASYINQALKDLDNEFQIVDWEGLNSRKKIEKVCYFVTEFWHIHPFREGNTRTTAMLLYFLIKKAGLHINISFLSKNGKYFRNALVLNSLYSNSKPEYILGIVTDAVTVRNVSNKKYETIEGFEVNKYSYTNHTVNKIKTIKKADDWNK
ncbi:MAG: Fic family protein [Bacilli bacterium]|nr:Fic family protein [Bacilli bacterium]